MENCKSAIVLCVIIRSFTCLNLSFGFDTLVPSQTLVHGQTLISPDQVFEMGFFSPGSSKKTFLGIWYKSTPSVVVWVANRNKPVTNSKGLRLTIVGNKSLAIITSRGIIWSSDTIWVASNPILRILNTGNLILIATTAEGSLLRYMWQSFDHPTDTLLPGMKLVDDTDAGVQRYLTSWTNSDDPSPGDVILKIHNQGLPDVVLSKGMKKIYRAGTWNGLYFSGFSPFPNLVFDLEMVFKEEKLISITRPYNNSTSRRLMLDRTSLVQSLVLNAKKDDWNPVLINPQDPCEEYGKCGPFGICTLGKTIRCECFKGFIPKSKTNWDLQDWSGGCTRITRLNCRSKDHGFLEVTGTNYPDMLEFWLNTSMSLDECKVACLKNCSCIAYANPYITNGGTGCLMWFGELIDTKYLPKVDNKQKIYIRLPYSELNSSITLEKQQTKNKPVMFILTSIVSGVVVSCFINGVIHYMTRRIKDEKTHEDSELPLFKLSTIMTATNNFSEENMIGKGGFGHVYWGNLATKVEIAAKRLSKNSTQGLAEFTNEVTLITKLQHRNLVKLLGCCIEREERILIYEYLQNRSLDTFIFDQNRKTHLTWPKRFDIIMGIAKGMSYLHHDSRLTIIHRDLKTNNVLLDGKLNAKISDFGIARSFEEDQSTLRTKTIVGTYGYMSPEYVITGNFSTKSDIFSLGVVLLEIISGKTNRGSVDFDQYDHSLLEHAWLLWKENRTLELLDECLNYTCIESQVKTCVHVGLLCVQKHPEDRPNMMSVCSMLASDEAIQIEPKEPGFFIDRSLKMVKTGALASANFKNGTMTVTELEGR